MSQSQKSQNERTDFPFESSAVVNATEFLQCEFSSHTRVEMFENQVNGQAI